MHTQYVLRSISISFRSSSMHFAVLHTTTSNVLTVSIILTTTPPPRNKRTDFQRIKTKLRIKKKKEERREEEEPRVVTYTTTKKEEEQRKRERAGRGTRGRVTYSISILSNIFTVLHFKPTKYGHLADGE